MKRTEDIMFCPFCGKKIDDEAAQCSHCQAVLTHQVPFQAMPVSQSPVADDSRAVFDAQYPQTMPAPASPAAGNLRTNQTMVCPKCGSNNVSVQKIAERKKRGCFAVFLWILLCLLTFFLVILIPLLIRKGSKITTWAVCQNCGNTWKI